MSWFQQGQTYSEFKGESKKSGKSFNSFPFSLTKGETAKIAILNPDDDPPPILHYHNITDPENPKVFHKVICALPEEDECHFCTYASTRPESDQWRWNIKKVCCHSILDLREYTDKNGKVYPAQRRLRLTQEGQMKNLQKIWHKIETDPDFSDIPTLQYAILSVTRGSEEKSASIGEADPPRKMLDLTKYEPDLLRPMTEEEILEYFVAKGTPLYDKLVEAYQIKDAVSKSVTKKKV